MEAKSYENNQFEENDIEVKESGINAHECPVPIAMIEDYVRIPPVLTYEEIPTKISNEGIKALSPQELYLYMIKGIALQTPYCVIGDEIWILSFNFVMNGDKMYCVADKVKYPQNSRGRRFVIRERLFTKKEICVRYKLNESQLPQMVMHTQACKDKLQSVSEFFFPIYQSEFVAILNLNRKWHTAQIYNKFNEKACNKAEIKLTLTKEEFLRRLCCISQGIFIVVPNENGYSAEILLKVTMGGQDIQPHNIGVSFRESRSWPNKYKYKYEVGGFYNDVSEMKVYALLSGCAYAYIRIFANGWCSNYNCLAIGDRKLAENNLARKQKELQQCKQEEKELQRILINKRQECKDLAGKLQHCEKELQQVKELVAVCDDEKKRAVIDNAVNVCNKADAMLNNGNNRGGGGLQQMYSNKNKCLASQIYNKNDV